MSSSNKRKGVRSMDNLSGDEVRVISMITDRSGADLSSTDDSVAGSVKRLKSGSPKKKRAAKVTTGKTLGDVAGDGMGSCNSEVTLCGVSEEMAPPKRKVKKRTQDDAVGLISDLKAITNGLMDVVLDGGVDTETIRAVMGHSARYESLLMRLIAENERLKGRLEASAPVAIPMVGTSAVVAGAVKSATGRAGATAVAMDAPPVVPKPVETWSVVVRGKGVSSEDVVKKVVGEVGPSLGVRVHGVRPIKNGGAVIRTPSLAEREKIAANMKFAEVGLEVSVNDRLGPRVVVQRVHMEIATDDFMSELYEMNLKDSISFDVFKKSVRLVSSPWKQSDGYTNVVLEVSSKVMEVLTLAGAYIKWFRYAVVPQDPIQACFRCLGFDHRVRDCRMKEGICRRCGLTGHLATRCPNSICCRNCAFKGWPSDHMMMSKACPIIASKIAAVNARH